MTGAIHETTNEKNEEWVTRLGTPDQAGDGVSIPLKLQRKHKRRGYLAESTNEGLLS